MQTFLHYIMKTIDNKDHPVKKISSEKEIVTQGNGSASYPQKAQKQKLKKY